MTSIVDVLLGTLPEERLASVRSLLQRTFPDPRCLPSNTMIAAFLAGLPPEAQLAVCGATFLAEEILGTHPDEDPAVACYYTAQATHTRLRAPGKHSFTGTVPYVRVMLPEGDETDAGTDISSKLGMVYAGDHKLHSVRRIRQKYDFMLKYALKRVELITPARYPVHFGSRFSAVAVYALYDDSDALRSYILEAGMATGEAMVVYIAPQLHQKIVRTSWYKPTPFSDEKNTYVGEALWFQTAHLQRVDVAVHSGPSQGSDTPPATEPHLRIVADFSLLESPEPTLPAKLTAEAGLRVAAIAKAMGTKDVLMLALAPFGEALDWIQKPEAT